MNKIILQRTVVSVVAASILSGCAVSPALVSQAESTSRDNIAREKSRLDEQARALPLFEFVDANYLGSEPIPLARTTSLPRAFREKRVQLLGVRNLKDHAEKVAAVAGFSLRISQDVWTKPTPRLPQVGGVMPAVGAAAPASTQLRPTPTNGNGSMPPGSPFAVPAPTAQSIALAGYTNYADPANVKIDYDGNPVGALDALTIPLGLTWTPSEQGNVVTISRYVTRRFPVRATGTSETDSSIDKGMTANSGSIGGVGSTGSTNTGNFSAASRLKSESAKADPITVVATTIKNNYLTPDGTVTPDVTTGSVVVTDSQYVIDQVARYMEGQNEALGRQAQVSIRTITLQLNDSSQQAFDVSLIYSKLSGGVAQWSLSTAAPKSLTSSETGSVAFNVLSPTSPFNGTAIDVRSLEGIGKIIGDNTRTLITKNRQTVGRIDFDSDAYLASTNPGAGNLAGSGVPGLTPGTQTVGTSIILTPTIYDSNVIGLELSQDESVARPFRTAGAGQGATQQTLELPRESGNKGLHKVDVRSGQSMVLVGYDSEKIQADRRYGLTGASNNATNSRVVTIVVVTASIVPGA